MKKMFEWENLKYYFIMKEHFHILYFYKIFHFNTEYYINILLEKEEIFLEKIHQLLINF